MNILIVGRNAALSTEIAGEIEPAGYTTEIVDTVDSVLERLSQEGIDLLLVMEVMAPDLYGDTFLKTIRKQFPEIPVFAFTDGSAFPGWKDFPEDPQDEGRSLYYFLHREGYSPDAYLSSPPKPKELIAFLKRCFGP